MTISGFIAYAIQTWKNKPDTSTPLSAARLAHIEAGIKANSDAITKLAAAVINQQANDVNKIPSSALMYSVNEKVDSAISDLSNTNVAAALKLPKDCIRLYWQPITATPNVYSETVITFTVPMPGYPVVFLTPGTTGDTLIKMTAKSVSPNGFTIGVTSPLSSFAVGYLAICLP